MTDPDKLPESLEIRLPGDVPMLLRRILPGSFRMGSRGKNDAEAPAHLVKIPEPFYLGIFPVTQEQYRALAPLAGLDPEPSYFNDREDSARRPVEQVSWDNAMAVCRKLSEAGCFTEALDKIGLDPKKWQLGLPSEATWEYACRAGSETDYWNGDGEAALADGGWYGANSGDETHPVGEGHPANPWGLHDMHGNVWEWCADIWDVKAYRKRIDGWPAETWSEEDAEENAKGLENARFRVPRGGSWDVIARACRSAYRSSDWSNSGYRNNGFRLCVFPDSGDANQPPEAETGAESAAGGKPRRDDESVPQAGDGAALVDLRQAKLPAAERPQNF